MDAEREISRQETAGDTDFPSATRLRLRVGGNCNTDFLVPGLRVTLLDEGILASVTTTAYDDWIGAALDGDGETDVWVIWLSAIGWTLNGQRREMLPLEPVIAALHAICDRGERVLLILPEPCRMETDPFSPFLEWRRRITERLLADIPERVCALNPEPIVRMVGTQLWYADRYWITAKCPCSPDAATFLAQWAGLAVSRMVRPRVRAVVTDLDNTLWGGIVGEDGVHGVDLDAHGTGAPYLALQRFLKDLSKTGVPLAVASKNNPEDAIAVFRERREMILKEDDFVLLSMTWADKAEAIQEIADELRLGLDSICFLDDSPHERAEALFHLPDLLVPDLPESPEERVGWLVDSGLFLNPAPNKDDAARAQFYKADTKRKRVERSISNRDEFLSGLKMAITPQSINQDILGRVTQLVQKTNQFNLTNRRHDSKAMLAISRKQGTYPYAFSVNDCFGDAGMVGVLIAETADVGVMEIDTWVLSCRVINRGIEQAMFEHLCRWAIGQGITRLRGRYMKNAKNGLVANLFSSLGLTPVGRDDRGEVFEGKIPPLPPHHLTFAE